MKQKHTQAKKANRYNQRIAGIHTMRVFARRMNGIYGADHRSFDEKNPGLEEAVTGLRTRIALAEMSGNEKPATE